LKGVHHSAVAAGIAAEAAGRQGKFWEMHDLLFEKQSEWANKKNSKDDFVSYASFLGLDLEKFKQDSENSELKGKVSEAYPNGLDLGLNSTPTFFINGQMITPSNLDEFRNIISNALGSQTE
jgi:protein-disulfide isomerase